MPDSSCSSVGEGRVQAAAAQAEVQQRAGSLGLPLRAQDAGGGAGGLGARDAAFDDGDRGALLAQAQGDRAAHDAGADHDHVGGGHDRECIVRPRVRSIDLLRASLALGAALVRRCSAAASAPPGTSLPTAGRGAGRHRAPPPPHPAG